MQTTRKQDGSAEVKFWASSVSCCLKSKIFWSFQNKHNMHSFMTAWLLDLTDLLDMLNDLNLALQGQDKHVINMISCNCF